MEYTKRREVEHTPLGDIIYEVWETPWGQEVGRKCIKNTCSYKNAPKGWHPGTW